MIRSPSSILKVAVSALYWVWFVAYPSVLSGQSPDSTEVFSLIARSHADLKDGNTSALTQRLDSLEGVQKKIGRKDWRVIVLCALTEIHTSNQSLEEAETFSSLALKTLHSTRKSLPDTLVDETYYLHALLQQEKGDWASFAIYMDSSFQVLRRLDKANPIREARNAISMSYMTYNEGKLGKTVEWTKSGIQKMLQVERLTNSDSTQLASLYSNIAFLNNVAGRFDDVVPNYNLAIQFDPSLVTPYINQAVLLRSTQPKRSIELSRQALQHIPSTSYHNRCNAYTNILSSSLVLAGSQEDEAYFNMALQYHDSIIGMSPYARTNDYPFDANSHGLFADYYSRRAKKRDIDKAWFHLEQNLELIAKYKSGGATRGLTYLVLNPKERLARLSIMKGDYLTADTLLKEVNKGYHGADYPYEDDFVISKEYLLKSSNTLVYPLTYISNLLAWSEQDSDPTAKLEEANHIYKVVDSTYDAILEKNELEIESLDIDRLHTRGAIIAIRMYEHTGLRDHLVKAHTRIEKLFSLDLFSNLVKARLRNSTDAESAIYKEKLLVREEIDLLIRQESDDERDKQRLDSLNKAYITIIEKLGTQYKSENIKTNISLDEISQKIDSNEVVLYYIHDKMSSSLYGLGITQDTILSFKQEVKDLESLIYLTNVSVANPASTNYKEQLQQLYDLFIGDIADVIDGKSITICSMGKLELAPYDLLMDKEGNYLCFNHPIRHVYSAGWIDISTTQRSSGIQGYTSSPKNKTAALEVRDGLVSNLSAAREEVAFLKEEYGAKVFVDEKSTKEKFIASAQNASILHLALHGVANPLEPIKSRLIFSLDGNKEEDLYFHEIDDLDINAQLVTLSACNSGLGNIHGAGSIASLARAFHYADCPNVVQTLWSVNDETSLQLMKSFYKNLHEGQTISTALSTAKKQFYNSSPKKWRHPYYWGGYVFNGQNVSLNIKKKSMLSSYAIPAGFVIILLLVFISRYKSI